MQTWREQDLANLYGRRFSEAETRSKANAWTVLCEAIFQQYVPEDGTVLDLGAGRCEFINRIRAERRIAVDLNPDTLRHAEPGVEVILTSSSDLSGVAPGSVDTVFTSNFFEHLPGKDELVNTLREVHQILRPGGPIVVMMPNIRYLPGRYWDFLDHHLPLTHLSLAEALALTGFQPTRIVPRFIPYTSKDSRIAVPQAAVRAYLALPLAWRLVGRQMLVVAQRDGSPARRDL